MEIKIKSYYISKEFFINFLFAVGITVFIFSLDAVFQIIEVLVKGTFYPVIVLFIFFLTLFSSFLYIIPLSFLYASSSLFSRLAIDRETLIFSSSGINPYRLTSILLIFAFIGSLFLLIFNFFLLPEMSYKRREMIYRLQFKNPLSLLQEKNTTTDIPGITIYIEEIKPSYKIKNVSITYTEMEKTHFLKAERGGANYDPVTNQMVFNLQNGFLLIYDSVQTISKLDFANYRFVIPLPHNFGTHGTIKPKVSEMYIAELLSGNGMREKIEIQKRIVFSVIPIVFVLIGTSLGIKLRQESRLLHIGIGGGIAMLFLQLVVFGEILSYKTEISLFVWLPVVILLIVW
ncbi:MAG: LptF/LptG family permease, partial [Candidatus Omnitrophica bacterium]|nr:LptF/LptG family permease [Candidatus Omnitrophota bacterium]